MHRNTFALFLIIKLIMLPLHDLYLKSDEKAVDKLECLSCNNFNNDLVFVQFIYFLAHHYQGKIFLKVLTNRKDRLQR